MFSIILCQHTFQLVLLFVLKSFPENSICFQLSSSLISNFLEIIVWKFFILLNEAMLSELFAELVIDSDDDDNDKHSHLTCTDSFVYVPLDRSPRWFLDDHLVSFKVFELLLLYFVHFISFYIFSP